MKIKQKPALCYFRLAGASILSENDRVVFHITETSLRVSVVSLQPALDVGAEQRTGGGSTVCVSKLTTHFCTPASTSSLWSTGFAEFSWNTHIHHCRGHKQLSISSNPLFRINKSFSCSFLSCAVTFLWLIKFKLADGAQHDAWQVTYIGVSNPLQRSHK